jgi:hypothetical protein
MCYGLLIPVTPKIKFSVSVFTYRSVSSLDIGENSLQFTDMEEGLKFCLMMTMLRQRLILNTELSAKNKMQVNGSLVVPVLRYSFRIINWHQEEIQKLDRRTRKMLTIHGQHHPRAEIGHLYVLRKEGGRGLMQVEGAYTAETVKMVEYVESKDDPLKQIVGTHQHNTDSTLFQTVNIFKKSFQRESKQIKTMIALNINEKWDK